MGSSVIKGLRFVDTQELCFEAWKRSYIACSALLCGQFADSQKSRFQASKRTNMCGAVLEGGRPANIHEFCFQAANVLIWNVYNYKWVYLLIVTNGILCCKRFR